MMGFYIVAPFLDVFAKLASSQILIARITTFRFLVQTFLMLPIFRLTKYKLRFSRSLIQGSCYERYFKEYWSYSHTAGYCCFGSIISLTGMTFGHYLAKRISYLLNRRLFIVYGSLAQGYLPRFGIWWWCPRYDMPLQRRWHLCVIWTSLSPD